MEKIIVTTRTNGKYGRVKPGDVLVVGQDIDQKGAERWVKVGLAKKNDLKVSRKQGEPEEVTAPTAENTVKQIKSYLKAEGIEFAKNLTKDELLALCEK